MRSLISKLREQGLTLEREPSVLDTVLIAEDDPLFRHLLQSWLTKWKYRVVATDNGMDAWNILQQEDSPQMAILDWIMPGMDGVELCRRIRCCEPGPYRYLLLLTAKDDKQDVVQGLEAGADDYLTKPFNVDELRARVRAGRRILELQEALTRTHQALQFEAAHDGLTGLWNHRSIVDTLERELQRSSRTGEPLGLILADVDHFKQVNDSYGHLSGDSVLQAMAHRLTAAVRNYDSVGRYGGEEFMIVLPGCNAADLSASGERLRACVASQSFSVNTGQLFLTVSIGSVSAQAPASGLLDCEALICAADDALYQAKARGRNRVEAVSEIPARPRA